MISSLEKLCIDSKFKKQRLQNEDRKSVLDLNTVLNFVESKNRKQSQTMKTAFRVAKYSGMNPVWITVEQALDLCKDIKNHVLIIETFRSDLFDKLHQNAHLQIYGPSCIYYCKNLYLPRRRFPIFNLCMRNLEICVDNEFSSDEVLQMFGLITLMCGSFSPAFRPTTTHLISTNYKTDKSKLARAYGVPIVNKNWVKECWEMSLTRELNADDQSIIDKFSFPIFTGFRINISQIEDDVRIKLKNLITKHGGDFVDFRPRIVTHLIVGEAKGEKYSCAKQSNIKIMKQDWIEDSVKCGYPLLEYDYLFEPSSTQPAKFDFHKYDGVLEPNLNSQIEQARRRSSQINSIIDSETLVQIKTQINSQQYNKSQIITPSSPELTQPDQPRPLMPEAAKTYCVKSKTELAKSNSDKNSTKRTAFSVLTSSQSTNKQKNSTNPENELEKLVNQLKECKSSTFDGCDFYIHCRFSTSIESLLKQCIQYQNGQISKSLRSSVSHVIVKEEIPETERLKLSEELDKFDHTINQVDLKWIIQCSKSNKLVPIIKVNLVESPTNKEQQQSYGLDTMNTSKRQSSQSQRRSKFAKHNQLPIVQQLPIREVEASKADDLFSEYGDKSIIQSNVASSSQVDKNVHDLELMRREEKPLYGCVLTISLYKVALKDELTSIARKLGATCQPEFVKNNKSNLGKLKNTHLVCDEAKGDKYEKAIHWGVPVVNQYWLRKCLELVERVDTTDYQPKVVEGSDNRQLHQTDQTHSPVSVVSPSCSSGNSSQILSQTTNFPAIQRAITNIANQSVPCISQTVESKFKNFMRNELKPVEPMNKLLVTDDDSGDSRETHLKIDVLNEDRSCFKNNTRMDNIPIAWDDHRKQSIGNTSFSLPTKLLPKSTNNITINQTFDQTTDACSSVQPNLIVRQSIAPFQVFEDTATEQTIDREYEFNFIGYSPQEKQAFKCALCKLNIRVTEQNDLKFDFLITQPTKLIKNESILVSIATGKWVVHPDFYQKTIQTGRIPNPEEYEWGSSDKYLSALEPKYVQLAKACRYWRLKVKETKKSAFSGQKLLIVSPNAKSYASIIINGGGQALCAELHFEDRENYTSVLTEVYQKLKQGTIENLNYILINFKRKERDQLNILNLIRPIEALNIRCLQIDYISLFLVSDRHLNIKNLLIDNSSSAVAGKLKRSLSRSDDISNISTIIARK